MSRHREQLTARQARFVNEYLIDLNGTQAVIRAGYRTRSPEVHASRLLARPLVAKAITAAQAARAKRTEITADRVIHELARIAFADVRDVVQWGKHLVTLRPSSELTAEQAASIATIEADVTARANGTPQLKIRVRMHDKAQALQTLARHFGLLLDRHEVSLPDEQVQYLVQVARVCLAEAARMKSEPRAITIDVSALATTSGNGAG